jgi:hypothetical protein
MSWLLPGFLGAGLLAGLPILLHFLRKKPKQRIPFPSLRFVNPSVLQTRKVQQLMRWIVLALRCAIILSLASAFARPFWARPLAPAGRAVVVAVDNSFSMQSRDRWEALRLWALSKAGTLSPGDRAGVLVMGPSPVWLVPLSEDTEAFVTALRHIQPGYGTVRYGPSLAMAAEALAQSPAQQKQLVWMGDQQRTSWQDVDFSRPLAPGVKLLFPTAQAVPSRQAAITGMINHGSSVDVHIRQFAPARDRRVLSIVANGKQARTQPVDLDASKPLSVTLPIEPGTEWLQVSLDPDDCPADDIGYAITSQDAALSVLLPPSKEPDFLRKAIEASSQKGLQPLRSEPPADVQWPLDSVAVLRGPEIFRPPLLKQVNAFVDAGGAAWVLLDGSPEQIAWLKGRGITASANRTKQRLCGLEVDHPVFTAFADSSLMPLLEPEFASGFKLAGENLAPLAFWTDRSVAIAESGHLLISGFDLSRVVSALPISPAFVPLVHQTLTYLGQSRDTHAGDYRVGQPIELPPQPGTWTSVAAPLPSPPMSVNGSVVATQPGIYRYEPNPVHGGRERLYAVNVPEEESDLAPLPGEPWKKLENTAPAPSAKGWMTIQGAAEKNGAWWGLIFAAALLLVLETIMSNRTAL